MSDSGLRAALPLLILGTLAACAQPSETERPVFRPGVERGPVPWTGIPEANGGPLRFAIVSEKKKCISCNLCTSVCHQGIDVMSFANRGDPMRDPQCVRCSACVSSCPTQVLSFGQVDRDDRVIHLNVLRATVGIDQKI